jgi:hypothetical protein
MFGAPAEHDTVGAGTGLTSGGIDALLGSCGGGSAAVDPHSPSRVQLSNGTHFAVVHALR